MAKPIPKSKRFFKVHELAGNRWPAVTEDEICNWHDADFKVPIDTGEGLVETKEGHYWNDPVHGGFINLMSFWVFLPELISIRPVESSPAAVKGTHCWHAEQITQQLYRKLGHKLYGNHLYNSFFMLMTDDAKGFAFNKTGKVKVLIVFGDDGMVHSCGRIKEGPHRYEVCQLEVSREDLLIRASSVTTLEAIAPELTAGTSPRKGEAIMSTIQECLQQSTPLNKAEDQLEDQLSSPPGSKSLIGWKAIATYTGDSLSTVKRHFKGASCVRYNVKTRKITTTTAAIDEWRLKATTKKRKK